MQSIIERSRFIYQPKNVVVKTRPIKTLDLEALTFENADNFIERYLRKPTLFIQHFPEYKKNLVEQDITNHKSLLFDRFLIKLVINKLKNKYQLKV